MIQWTIINKNLDPLSFLFQKTNTRKRHKNSLLFVNIVTKLNIFDFSIFAIFHFRIPVSILSSFRPLASVMSYLAFRYRLSTSVRCLIYKRYLSGENDSFVCFNV